MKVSIEVPDEIYQRLKAVADEKGVSVEELISPPNHAAELQRLKAGLASARKMTRQEGIALLRSKGNRKPSAKDQRLVSKDIKVLAGKLIFPSGANTIYRSVWPAKATNFVKFVTFKQVELTKEIKVRANITGRSVKLPSGLKGRIVERPDNKKIIQFTDENGSTLEMPLPK